MSTLIELEISKEVAASTEDCDTYTPANGSVVNILKFVGSAAFSPNASVKLVWDWDGAGETVLWSHKGEGVAPKRFQVTGDGVKKLAVCLDNGETGALFMSGYAEIEV